MSTSSSYTADATFSSSYTPSDSSSSFIQIVGTTINISQQRTPSSSSDTGTSGEICYDASYIYVCTATNTWKRSVIATW